MSVIALTAVVVASVTLVFHKQQDNALLLQRIDTLKAENAVLRKQVHQFTPAQTSLPPQGPAQPAADAARPAGGKQASDS